MFKNHRIIIAASTLSLVVAGGIALDPLWATPGFNFAPSPLSVAQYPALDVKAVKDQKWDLLLKTKDDTDIGVDVLTVQVGGYSGWHSHAGPTFITIKTGQITWYDQADCSARVYGPGDSFIEKAQRPHFVKNTGSEVATFVAVQMRPEGAPGRVDELAPTTCTIPS